MFLSLIRPFSSSSCIFTKRYVSTVHQGVAFERHSLAVLRQAMSMSLKRVGGKEDGGVDLIGWWWLPHNSMEPSTRTLHRRRLRVVGQCKAEKKKMGPNYVRELEGVLYRYMTDPKDRARHISCEETDIRAASALDFEMVALLISQSPFTKSTILRANSSSIPFLLLHLPAQPPETDTNVVSEELGTAWCNSALGGAQGLLEGCMDIRWERNPLGSGGRPAIYWNGSRLPSWLPPVDSELIAA
ncbi:hypothetical protein CPB83DRAFT_855740 [Crepidotus variabilis]|uniref:Uncharacterized protein n=1 Tax=Crepidotus variabilis TaxID=179855 RepID=A0A9P6JNQ1_9AGAR|nr:hypothetical protein CPB83DRAFT_855740 [Crepidotus variabilis]